MFIQVEKTPNPSALKFLPGVTVNSGDPVELTINDSKVENFPLATTIFGIEQVIKVFFGHDFISVTKSDNIEWDVLKPQVLTVIMDFFTVNPLGEVRNVNDKLEDNDEAEEFYDEKDLEKVNQVKELIENYIRPAVAQDGGDIKFRGYNQGTVFVKLRGACSGCPSASVTLKHGIENMLKYHIPDIECVEEVF